MRRLFFRQKPDREEEEQTWVESNTNALEKHVTGTRPRSHDTDLPPLDCACASVAWHGMAWHLCTEPILPRPVLVGFPFLFLGNRAKKKRTRNLSPAFVVCWHHVLVVGLIAISCAQQQQHAAGGCGVWVDAMYARAREGKAEGQSVTAGLSRADAYGCFWGRGSITHLISWNGRQQERQSSVVWLSTYHECSITSEQVRSQSSPSVPFVINRWASA